MYLQLIKSRKKEFPHYESLNKYNMTACKRGVIYRLALSFEMCKPNVCTFRGHISQLIYLNTSLPQFFCEGFSFLEYRILLVGLSLMMGLLQQCFSQ